MITALIPAHNEAESLTDTISSIRAQTVRVNRIVVVSDNSTDETVNVARTLGVEVMETVDNFKRKAGALNQALDRLPREGFVLAMDADTQLSPGWIEAALNEMEDSLVGGVGAVFKSAPPTTYLELCQSLEWERYAEQTDRTGKTFVMSGTAALIRWEALESVYGRFGRYYDEGTITEDSRISIDLKLLGWDLRSPVECATITETMSTVPSLFVQRRRWYLGAIQNARDTGLNRVTWPYWRQQILLAVSVLLMWLYLSLTIYAAVSGGMSVEPFWLGIGFIFVVERVATIWNRSRWERLFAALIIPELIYALILQVAYLAAIIQAIQGSEGSWHHQGTEERREKRENVYA